MHQARLAPAHAPALALRALFALSAALTAGPAHASFFSGDALDAVANFMSWFVLAVVPLVVITLFWMVHVMPEKIAHKRHHPQTQAIHTLCLLSLFFGGLLWPIAWLWAYTKPIGYRMAYGTDKHEDYHLGQAAKAREGMLSADELAHLRDELDAMAARGALPPNLKGVRQELDAMPLPAPAAAGSAA